MAAIGIGVLLIKDVFDTRDRRWRSEEIARAARRHLAALALTRTSVLQPYRVIVIASDQSRETFVVQLPSGPRPGEETRASARRNRACPLPRLWRSLRSRRRHHRRPGRQAPASGLEPGANMRIARGLFAASTNPRRARSPEYRGALVDCS